MRVKVAGMARSSLRHLITCSVLLVSALAFIINFSSVEGTGLNPAGVGGRSTPAAATTVNTEGITRTDVSIDAVTVLLPAHVATSQRTFVVY